MNFSEEKKGYNKQEVNSYIATLENVVKSYKDKDATIKNAILSAQVSADNIVKNAEMQANDLRNRAIEELDNIKNSISEQKAFLDNFQRDYNILMDKYFCKINNDDITILKQKVENFEIYLEKIRSTGESYKVQPGVIEEDQKEQLPQSS